MDGNGNPIIAYASRLGSVANNFGYRIVYGYVRDSITGGGGEPHHLKQSSYFSMWQKADSSKGFRKAEPLGGLKSLNNAMMRSELRDSLLV